MVNIFKSLNPLNVLWLIVLLVILRAGWLLHMPATLQFPFDEPLGRLLLVTGAYTIPPFYNIVAAAAIVLIQALLVNYLVNHYNLLGKPTFLPALMYVMVSALFTPFLILSLPLLCNF